MAQFDDLLPYLPAGDYEPLFSKWLEGLNYQITISRPRKSKLGDFRPPRLGQIARITMNADLGPFQFLTTLTHEIAHLIAWEKFGRRAAPHGKEWKAIFREMLIELAQHQAWPENYSRALLKHAKSPKAAVGADPHLQQTLLLLDESTDLLLQSLGAGEQFTFKGRHFRYDEKRRTRALVTELGTKKQYTIPLVARVERID
ncbi:MAG: SprT-like domain-containing protein [Cryomorphaceae bacterium]|nr:SprT-like domain-containing protein [Cryomorphaceae bacterium]MBL6682659.1 SprT-like domain-containing protein [Cryomorphaceae bacterium]MBL6867113.1 SprT-like domain-containing protein [Cryomorphaceae bacterium]